MKKINKYLLINICIACVTISVNAAPKTYRSLSSQLEPVQIDCKIYQNTASVSTTIRNSCKKYNHKVKKAFNLGYKIDSYLDSDNISEKKLENYLTLLKDADKYREIITSQIGREIIVARTNSNIPYYSDLILGGVNHFKLGDEDYFFIKKNQSELQGNPICIEYMTNLEKKSQEKEEEKKRIQFMKKEKERLFAKSKELKINKARKEKNNRLVTQALKDLENQKKRREKKLLYAKKQKESDLRYEKRQKKYKELSTPIIHELEALSCKEEHGEVLNKLNQNTYEITLGMNLILNGSYVPKIHSILKTITTKYTNRGKTNFCIQKDTGSTKVKMDNGFTKTYTVYYECTNSVRWRELTLKLRALRSSRPVKVIWNLGVN
jgi:hypothetical protein